MIYTALSPAFEFLTDKKPVFFAHLMQNSAPPPLPVPSAESPSSAMLQTSEMLPERF